MRPLPRNRRTRTKSRDPLAQLRRRCALGAGAATAVFVATFIADAIDVAGLDRGNGTAVIGVELCMAATGMTCALVAILTWIITAHVAYLASLWTMIENIQSGNMAEPGPRVLGAGIHESGRPGMPAPPAPIPIQRGHDMKQQRKDRNAG